MPFATETKSEASSLESKVSGLQSQASGGESRDPRPETQDPNLTRVQKIAVLLFMLGPDTAGEVLKHCDEKEIEAVSAEMMRINLVSQELQAEVLREFTQVAAQAGHAVSGGADFTRHALEKAVGRLKASRIVRRVANGPPSATLQPILNADPRELYSLIAPEQPQTIALLVSHLPAEVASKLLAVCSPELRDQVVERLATIAPTPASVIEKIVAVLSRKLATKPLRGLSRTGGMKSAATLLNALDRHTSEAVLASIEVRNPDLGQAIRQKMLLFEDMWQLEPSALQKILREVDLNDLTVALKKASEPLKTALLGCISKRAAETVREELSFLGAIKVKDVEAAQSRIVEVARRLESEGEIELNAGEESRENEVFA